MTLYYLIDKKGSLLHKIFTAEALLGEKIEGECNELTTSGSVELKT